MLVTAIHKRHNIDSLEQGTTRHASDYDIRYSISISQLPPSVIITHYRMLLIEMVKHRVVKHRPCSAKRATKRKGQIRAHKKANYLNFRAAGWGQGAAWRSARLFRIAENTISIVLARKSRAYFWPIL